MIYYIKHRFNTGRDAGIDEDVHYATEIGLAAADEEDQPDAEAPADPSTAAERARYAARKQGLEDSALSALVPLEREGTWCLLRDFPQRILVFSKGIAG